VIDVDPARPQDAQGVEMFYFQWTKARREPAAKNGMPALSLEIA
jgi:hypothetical protein